MPPQTGPRQTDGAAADGAAQTGPAASSIGTGPPLQCRCVRIGHGGIGDCEFEIGTLVSAAHVARAPNEALFFPSILREQRLALPGQHVLGGALRRRARLFQA